MTRRPIPMPRPTHPHAWAGVRWVVFVGTLVWAGLLFRGTESLLDWTWNVIVPLLPATFLVSPALWRNVCPLATLNELPHRIREPIRTPPVWAATGVAAVVALTLLIPLRRAVLNGSPLWTVAAVSGLSLAALLLGSLFAARSGFCNAACPILPVERLYGQHPLLDVRGSRCASCVLCTPRGCVDLAKGKAMAQVLGPARHDARWLLEPMGAFAAAFPGIILAYFTAPDAVTMTLAPWLRVLAWGGVSYGLVTLTVRGLRVRGSLGMTLLAACSFGLYYAFAATGMAGTLGLGPVGANLIRVAAGALLVFWLVRALVPRPPRRDTGSERRRHASLSSEARP